MEELPGADRLRLKVMVGSLKMIALQIRDFPVELRERLGLPIEAIFDGWRGAAEQLYENSTNIPEAPVERPKTLG